MSRFRPSLIVSLFAIRYGISACFPQSHHEDDTDSSSVALLLIVITIILSHLFFSARARLNRNYGFWSYIGNQLAFKGMKPAKVIDATDDVPSAKKYIDMISEEMDGPRNFYGIAFAYAHDLITREMFIKYMDARDEYINTLREIKDAIKG